ncbi:MAG TPA: FG-GAP repeat protein [Polyangiaceae bacterium]|nr:FG-GAP repeat protein [Polyangiaceae bacterium]
MPRSALPLLALLLPACSWSRFDDVGENAPVVILRKPAKYPSFGFSLATALNPDKSSRVFVGGTSGHTPGSVFELGLGTTPITDAIDTGACAQGGPDDAPCFLGTSVAGVGSADVGGKTPGTQCFVMGVGKAAGSPEYGLIGRCQDTTEYTLTVPPDVLQKVIKEEILGQPAPNAPIVLAADEGQTAAIAAAAPVQGFAWYYQPGTVARSIAHPVPLVGPAKGKESKYGSALAVLRLGFHSDDTVDRRIVAVGSPEPGNVWLFEGDGSGNKVGCLGGIAGLGRTLASGPVDGDAFDDLVVADDQNVTVFSGAALAALEPADDVTCSLAALPPHGIIASFGCGSRDSVGGCPGGFATSLAVGDLDGDQDGEVIVGAPFMTAREKGAAGAVLVYDAEGPSPDALTDLLFLASADENDALGTAVAAAPIDGRDVIVAGAPGGGRTAVFYCSALGGAASGSRCQ